jgi:hypothetical protein
MNKATRYDQLVYKRKQFRFADGLLNPAQIEIGILPCKSKIGKK